MYALFINTSRHVAKIESPSVRITNCALHKVTCVCVTNYLHLLLYIHTCVCILCSQGQCLHTYIDTGSVKINITTKVRCAHRIRTDYTKRPWQMLRSRARRLSLSHEGIQHRGRCVCVCVCARPRVAFLKCQVHFRFRSRAQWKSSWFSFDSI